MTLERERPSPFLPEEVAAVEDAIARHPQPEDYHLAVKRDQIVISERTGLGGPDDLATRMGEALGLPQSQLGAIRDLINRQRNFMPVLRFLLYDAERRFYGA